MSLINDALKRAEEEKLRRLKGAQADEEAPEPSGDAPVAPASEPEPDEPADMWPTLAKTAPMPKARTLRSPRAGVIGFAVVALAAAGWLIWSLQTNRQPSDASADSVEQELAPRPVAHPQPSADSGSHAVHPAAAPSASPAGGNVQKPAVAPSQASVPDLPPPPPVGLPRATIPTVAAVTDKPATTTGGVSAAASPEALPPLPPPPPTPVVNVSRFHLIGIVRANGVSNACINGELLKVGDSIDGATLVEIGRNSVEMVKNGQKFRVSM
ncbi:MAG: hypothetical protein BIFFINMI_02580 [Phycisphaerae bacterium]|nr:hypothetical protein [Phycisphaerae bacterium]